MISKIRVLLLFMCFAIQVSGQEATILFSIKNAGLNVEGTFDDFEIKQQFLPEELDNTWFKASIKSTSINTGIKGRDKHLRKAKYFDVENYPNITFESTSILKTSTGLLVKGELTIKTTTLAVEIPVTLEEEGGSTWLKGYLEINRRDYGVGRKHLVMGNKVKINISVPYSEK